MERSHGFFIPDADYLVDLKGLLNYLGEKVAVSNTCIWCNGRGRELRSLEAVRKHMDDKSHCKIAYDTLKDRLDISDFYDFTSSYSSERSRPTEPPRLPKRVNEQTVDDGDWEDDEEIDEADEVVEAVSDEEVDPTAQVLSYGDTPFELLLPSGSRIGHRSLRRYYVQRFSDPLPSTTAFANSETAIMKRLLHDQRSTLIPASGADFGGAGRGMMTMKAKTVGQAREAGRHIREHRDFRARDAFKTKVGIHSNNHHHFRDQLLQ